MAMQEKALHASSTQAPYVSTASGMHCQPSSEHFVSFCSCFLDSAVCFCFGFFFFFQNCLSK